LKLFGATEVLKTFKEENKIERNSISNIKLISNITLLHQNVWESFSVDNDYALDFLDFYKSI
jgi:hypothetical protein